MTDVHVLFGKTQLTNKLAEEELNTQAHAMVLYSLTGAVASHRKSKTAETDVEREKSEGVMMAYIGVVAEAVSFHEAAPIIFDAIDKQKISDPRKLHQMARQIQPPLAA